MKSLIRKRYKLKSAVNDSMYLVQMPDETFFVDITYLNEPVEKSEHNTSYPQCPSCKTGLSIAAVNPHYRMIMGHDIPDWKEPNEFSVSTRYCLEHDEERCCNINIEYFVNGCIQYKYLNNITVESAQELIKDWNI